MKERKTSAVAAHSDRKPPEIFCRIFITLTSSSGRLLAKGTASAFIGPSRCPYRKRPTFAATAICARHLIYSGIYRIRRRFSRRREIDTEPSGFLVCADGGRVRRLGANAGNGQFHRAADGVRRLTIATKEPPDIFIWISRFTLRDIYANIAQNIL